ncbi:MAG: chloride channel protein, partial [Alphaproteobacteria bacterium]
MGIVRTYFDRLQQSQTARLLIIGLAIGILSAYGAIAFRLWISGTQFAAFGFSGEALGSYVTSLEPWRLYAALMGGGLLVGLMLKYLPLNDRPEGVADVIDAANFKNGHMSLSRGLSAALVSATSLGVGASAGREGPVVHLGATLAGAIANRLNMPPQAARTLLGCGIAAAVAASFNAPLAGAIFAHEIVLGHFALRSFGPIVIASVAGTVICRLHIGAAPAFIIP